MCFIACRMAHSPKEVTGNSQSSGREGRERKETGPIEKLLGFVQLETKKESAGALLFATLAVIGVQGTFTGGTVMPPSVSFEMTISVPTILWMLVMVPLFKVRHTWLDLNYRPDTYTHTHTHIHTQTDTQTHRHTDT